MRVGGLIPMSQASFHCAWGYLGPFRVKTRAAVSPGSATSPWGPLGPDLAANGTVSGEYSAAFFGRLGSGWPAQAPAWRSSAAG